MQLGLGIDLGNSAFLGRARPLIDPVPVGSPVVMLGDSINQNEFTAGTSLAQKQTGLIMNQPCIGEVYQALVTDPRVALVGYNDLTRTGSLLGNDAPYFNGSSQAYAGATLTDILAQITPAKNFVAGRTALGVIGGGTNSLTLSDAAFETAHAAILDAAHAAMPWVLWGVQNVRVTTFAASGTGSRTAANIAAKNAKILSNVTARPWCVLIDLAAYANDGGNPGYGLALNYQTNPYQASPGGDGLHPGQYGVTVLSYPSTLAFIQAHALEGNAIRLAKTGSALTASIGVNTGSGGTASSTAGTGGGVISGSAPTGITVAHGSAANVSSCVSSLEANAETGVQTHVLTITPSGSATVESFIVRPTGINYATTALQNQWARMWADIELNQGAGLLSLTMNSQERSNTNNNFQVAQIGLFPDGGAALRRFKGCVTPHLRYVAGSTGFQPSFQFKINPSAGAGECVVKIREWDLQIEGSPVSP